MKNTIRNILAVAVLALAGCGKAPSPATSEKTDSSSSTPVANANAAPAPTTASPAPATPPVGDAEKKLNLFCWSEYVPQTVIDQFTKETGIAVSVENYASNEEMLAKLLAGGGSYDLIQPSEYVIEGLVKEDRLQPIDHAMIPNLANIAPEFQNMPFDPGNKFSVPYMAGLVGIVVNTDLVKDDIKGYKDVFQDKYKKNIVVLDDAREQVSWALDTLSIPVNEVSDENLAKVKPILSQWLPLVKVFDSDSPKTAMLNGDVALGVVWGGEGAILFAQNPKFKWVVPAEGAHLFVDSLAIPKGSRHVQNAELFMNFILRPDISKQISDAFPYLNPNLAARKLLTPAQQTNPASYPTAEQMKKLEVFKDIGEQASKIDELVTTIKAQ